MFDRWVSKSPGVSAMSEMLIYVEFTKEECESLETWVLESQASSSAESLVDIISFPVLLLPLFHLVSISVEQDWSDVNLKMLNWTLLMGLEADLFCITHVK